MFLITFIYLIYLFIYKCVCECMCVPQHETVGQGRTVGIGSLL